MAKTWADEARSHTGLAAGGSAKWMQRAVEHPGALRETAKRQHLIKGDEPLSRGDLDKLADSPNPTTRRRAALAKTFAKERP